MSILNKLRKNTTIKESDILEDSKFFNKKDVISTTFPAINVILSGRLDGGFTPGLTMFAGPSKHFKTAFSLILAKAYQDKYPDAAILFYDSEFGSPASYFKMFGVDTSRVIHSPIADVEQLKFDIVNQLKEITRGDKVMIVIDSIGNLASKKEIDDALEQKSTTDMTRAKQIKSLFRMVTPHLTLKDIPMAVVNHTYKTMEMYSKDVVGGGTGSYYSSDNIYIIGRQQDKDGKELNGYNFVINAEKSRYVKEKSKVSINVTFESGINRWSGLLEMAMESGHIIKPKPGWYQTVDRETGEISDKNYREADTNTEEFWSPILASKSFNEFVIHKYALVGVGAE